MNEEARVQQFVKEHPNCSLNRVAKELNLSVLEALYYLTHLEEQKRIICKQEEGEEPKFHVPVAHEAKMTPRQFIRRLGGRITASFRGQA